MGVEENLAVDFPIASQITTCTHIASQPQLQLVLQTFSSISMGNASGSQAENTDDLLTESIFGPIDYSIDYSDPYWYQNTKPKFFPPDYEEGAPGNKLYFLRTIPESLTQG